MTTAKGDSRQFVSVQFRRSLVSIRPGEPRHPWHWCMVLQDGHIYSISDSFGTLAEAVMDFAEHGVDAVSEAERRLAEMYARPNEAVYDVGMVNGEAVR